MRQVEHDHQGQQPAEAPAVAQAQLDEHRQAIAGAFDDLLGTQEAAPSLGTRLWAATAAGDSARFQTRTS